MRIRTLDGREIEAREIIAITCRENSRRIFVAEIKGGGTVPLASGDAARLNSVALVMRNGERFDCRKRRLQRVRIET